MRTNIECIKSFYLLFKKEIALLPCKFCNNFLKIWLAATFAGARRGLKEYFVIIFDTLKKEEKKRRKMYNEILICHTQSEDVKGAEHAFECRGNGFLHYKDDGS